MLARCGGEGPLERLHAGIGVCPAIGERLFIERAEERLHGGEREEQRARGDKEANRILHR